MGRASCDNNGINLLSAQTCTVAIVSISSLFSSGRSVGILLVRSEKEKKISVKTEELLHSEKPRFHRKSFAFNTDEAHLLMKHIY